MPRIRSDATGRFVSYQSPQDQLSAYTRVDASTGCVVWTGAIGKDGYGKMTANYKTLRPHRVAYEISREVKLLPSQQLNHTCNNPACCNPDHLYVGTQQQNIIDRDSAGRQARGERHASCKLTEESVLEIRRMCEEGISNLQVAREFGVSRSTVYGIRTKRVWGWL